MQQVKAVLCGPGIIMQRANGLHFADLHFRRLDQLRREPDRTQLAERFQP